jgi:hypothetical protein
MVLLPQVKRAESDADCEDQKPSHGSDLQQFMSQSPPIAANGGRVLVVRQNCAPESTIKRSENAER